METTKTSPMKRLRAVLVALSVAVPASSSFAVLTVAICGHSEYECQSRPDALNETFGKPDTAVTPGMGGGEQVEVTNGENSERVPTTNDPAKQPAAPDAPASIAPTSRTEYSVSGWETTKGAACAVYVGQQPSSGTGGCGNAIPKTYTYAITSTDPACVYTTTITQEGGGVCATGSSTVGYSTRVVTSCPPGYTLSGGNCGLTDARAAVPDNKVDYPRTGNTLSEPATTDADTSIHITNESIGRMVNGTYQRSGKSPSGNPAHLEVRPTSDGGSRIVYTESQDNTVKQTTAVVGSDGTVKEVYRNTGSGTVYISPSTGTATVGASGVTNPGTGGSGSGTMAGLGAAGSGSGSGTGGATGADVANAAKSITDKLSEGTAPGLNAGDLNGAKNALENMTTPDVGYSGWFPSLTPGSAVSCSGIEFRGAVNVGPAAGLDSTTELNICPYLDVARQILGYLFGIGAVIYIWRKFVGAT